MKQPFLNRALVITPKTGDPFLCHVHGPTNEEITNDPLFVKSCELAKVRPTTRQASKYYNNKGLAHSHKREAALILSGKIRHE